MEFYRYPEWSGAIRNHYWHLRYSRGFDLVKIRKRYRYIAAEKKRLQSEGVDAEVLRLLCRHMVNPKNQKAEQRFWDEYFKIAKKSLF